MLTVTYQLVSCDLLVQDVLAFLIECVCLCVIDS